MSTITFSGYEWRVRETGAEKGGPGPNSFSALTENARVEDGVLILATTAAPERWRCAEASLPDALGHGEYRFTLASSMQDLERQHVFAAFLYEHDAQELDIEFSGAMIGRGKGQFVVQPGSQKGNAAAFKASRALVTSHSILWALDSVRFRSWSGDQYFSAKTRIAEWLYPMSGIQNPDKAKFIVNLWLFNGKPPRHAAEVRISNFSFTPL